MSGSEVSVDQLGGGTSQLSVQSPETRWRRPIALGFLVLLAVVAADAAHELLGFAGSGHSSLLDSDFADAVLAATGAFLIVRGFHRPREFAWILFGLANLTWLIGDLLWDLHFSKQRPQPTTSLSDLFWLSWYPLGLAGMVMLVRSRLRGFDLARWIDGIALALLVATPGVALALQPAIEASHHTVFDHLVIISYPALDILLLGAAVGVLALAGWRPGASWYLLSLALAGWVVADAVYSVQQVKGVYQQDVYDWLWPAGAVVLAYAGWRPRVVHQVEHIRGWRAVILPLGCQLVALGTQVWGLVGHLGESERIMGMAVLALVVVQLYVSRPPPPPATSSSPPDRR